MSQRQEIRIESIKLTTGDRLLRLAELRSGLALEKLLNQERSVVKQKDELMKSFRAALEEFCLP